MAADLEGLPDVMPDFYGETDSSRPCSQDESQNRPSESLVSVSLSDMDEKSKPSNEPSRPSSELTQNDAEPARPSSAEILSNPPLDLELKQCEARQMSTRILTIVTEGLSDASAQSPITDDQAPSARSRSDSSGSDGSVQVDWEELQRTEESEPRDEGSDESTAFLLARLEQENNALATDPKSAIKSRERRFSRPPSMNHIKRLAKDPAAPGLRYSLLPSPPPMTELDFWAALVKDFPQTAQRLPTLTSNKIRAGIPPPLRGVVWVSIAGARDRSLEEAFERLCGESSPYDNIIGKDIGRSFPGVEMFRDPEGEGQQMLGRVLKCFSLYDDKIGYCQGLGFLVGPLLMQMGEKEAFCILVRLMEDYGLRSCFLPNLSGLHLRIYQFQRLLRQHLPDLANHLESLQVEAAYLSQWFLSFFAVTCPLPMLFRIYDVILAEGASEMIMRVALSVMQRNEKKILASAEFEDVMQLLLSRALWDPYGCNATSADELVNDFVSFTGVVTRDSLQALELSFKEAQNDGSATRPAVQPEVQTAASRFLGRLWTRTSPPKTTSLSPPSAPSRPLSLIRRSASKQSLASTLNSIEGSSTSSGVASTTFTDGTALTRDSSTDSMSLKSPKASTPMSLTASQKDKDLHGQIEDLLTALSEMQREHALLAAQLQKEREDRSEDSRTVRSLIDKLNEEHAERKQDPRRRTVLGIGSSWDCNEITVARPSVDLSRLLQTVDARFSQAKDRRRSAALETKQQLRENLARTEEQLRLETSRSQDLSRRLSEQERETSQAREQLREARSRIQDNLRDKQRLEKNLHDLRNIRKGSFASQDSSQQESQGPFTLTKSDTSDSTGLREFKLGRPSSSRSGDQSRAQISTSSTTQHQSQPFAKRTSSLSAQAVFASSNNHPVPEDALLIELVNAKTAEAVARQELEEMKGKYDALRKSATASLSAASPSPATTPGANPVEAAISVKTPPATTSSSARTTSSASGGLGFWGWGKRSVSTSQVPTVQQGN